MDSQSSNGKSGLVAALKLKRLTLEQVRRIDEMLDAVGEYGEVHLIVQRGELRYMNKLESYKAWDDNHNK